MTVRPVGVRDTLNRRPARARGLLGELFVSAEAGPPRRVARLLPPEDRSLLSATPVGPELRFNTLTAGDQETFAEARRAVSKDAAGNLVIVRASNGQGGDWRGIYGQSATAGEPSFPAVAVAPGGQLVVTWSTKDQDGGGRGVSAQRFDASGPAAQVDPTEVLYAEEPDGPKREGEDDETLPGMVGGDEG